MSYASAQLGQTVIQNLTGRPMAVIDTDGDWGPPAQRWDLLPHETKSVDTACANKFLAERGRFVSIYVPTEFPTKDGQPKVWIANMTGSPFIEPTVKLKRIEKGKRVTVEVPNPLATAVTIQQTIPGGQKIVGSGDMAESINLPPIKIALAPFTRAPISISFAETMQDLDANNEDHHRGKLVVVDAPTAFEPHETWPLEWLQTYAEMVAFVNEKLMEEPWVDYIGTPTADFSEVEASRIRVQLYRALYFLCMDPMTSLPSEVDFKVELRARQANAPEPGVPVKKKAAGKKV